MVAGQAQNADTETASVGDVIQLDPVHSCWGPQLCIVDNVNPKSVRCIFFTDHVKDEPPGEAYLRVPHGQYVRIGRAAWLPGHLAEEMQEQSGRR
jgi:hypothetical protein